MIVGIPDETANAADDIGEHEIGIAEDEMCVSVQGYCSTDNLVAAAAVERVELRAILKNEIAAEAVKPSEDLNQTTAQDMKILGIAAIASVKIKLRPRVNDEVGRRIAKTGAHAMNA